MRRGPRTRRCDGTAIVTAPPVFAENMAAVAPRRNYRFAAVAADRARIRFAARRPPLLVWFAASAAVDLNDVVTVIARRVRGSGACRPGARRRC